jgi:sec-independent protein translocase protein TatA
MFRNIGMPEILVILVVVLLLFGAKRLPEIGSSFGRGLREFKRSLTDITEDRHEAEPGIRPPETRPVNDPQADSTPSRSGEPKRLSD